MQGLFIYMYVFVPMLMFFIKYAGFKKYVLFLRDYEL